MNQKLYGAYLRTSYETYSVSGIEYEPYTAFVHSAQIRSVDIRSDNGNVGRNQLETYYSLPDDWIILFWLDQLICLSTSFWASHSAKPV